MIWFCFLEVIVKEPPLPDPPRPSPQWKLNWNIYRFIYEKHQSTYNIVSHQQHCITVQQFACKKNSLVQSLHVFLCRDLFVCLLPRVVVSFCCYIHFFSGVLLLRTWFELFRLNWVIKDHAVFPSGIRADCNLATTTKKKPWHFCHHHSNIAFDLTRLHSRHLVSL